jgi:NADH dehydrogenase (ubiquinone) Fe-S protein 6
VPVTLLELNSHPTMMLLRQRIQSVTLRSLSSRANSSPAKWHAPSVTQAAPQAPNYQTTWSINQRPRPAVSSEPRFEQTAMELQPNPASAMKLIADEPVRIIHGRKAVCDGGT